MFLNLLTTIIHLPAKDSAGNHLNIFFDFLIVAITPEELQKLIIGIVVSLN